MNTLLDTEEWNRLRWQCRRGLLELDLVLERFLEKHCNRLHGERLSSFQTLLTYTDNEIWDLIRARTECRDVRFAEVVQWMRECLAPHSDVEDTAVGQTRKIPDLP